MRGTQTALDNVIIIIITIISIIVVVVIDIGINLAKFLLIALYQSLTMMCVVLFVPLCDKVLCQSAPVLLVALHRDTHTIIGVVPHLHKWCKNLYMKLL